MLEIHFEVLELNLGDGIEAIGDEVHCHARESCNARLPSKLPADVQEMLPEGLQKVEREGESAG